MAPGTVKRAILACVQMADAASSQEKSGGGGWGGSCLQATPLKAGQGLLNQAEFQIAQDLATHLPIESWTC